MTYIVTDACVRCKFMDCVEVCPVDCFYAVSYTHLTLPTKREV